MHIDGPKLRAARLAAGLTQERLATEADVTRQTVMSAEQGGPCLGRTIRAFAGVIGVPVEDITAEDVVS